MNTILTRLLLTLTLTALALAPASAQTTLTSTTLGAAVADATVTTVTLASATGVTGLSGGTITTWLLTDRELMSVRSVNGVIATVIRAANTSRATLHASGATVWIIPSTDAVKATMPSGGCLRTNLAYVPLVVMATQSFGELTNGNLFDCLGVTTAGQWVQTNTNGTPVLGSTVASPAGVLTPTGTVFKVSGTNAITGITLPAGAAPGFTLAIEPTGIFTWTTATNIAVAGTAVVGKILYFTWDGAKWAPSYIA